MKKLLIAVPVAIVGAVVASLAYRRAVAVYREVETYMQEWRLVAVYTDPNRFNEVVQTVDKLPECTVFTRFPKAQFFNCCVPAERMEEHMEELLSVKGVTRIELCPWTLAKSDN